MGTNAVKDKTVKVKGGFVVAIRGPIYQQKWWLKGGLYEPEMLRYIRKNHQGGTFLDVGACIGNHTRFFAAFCARQVIAVEPVKRNMEHLMENVKLSGLLDKVTPVQLAVGEKDGTGSMINPGKYHGQYELRKGNDVRVTTLDQISRLAKHPITLIKIDIEGSELNALKGATTLLSNQHPVIIAEAWEKQQIHDIKELLAKYNYRLKFKFKHKHNFVFV